MIEATRSLGALRDPPGTARGVALRHLVASGSADVPAAWSLAPRIAAGLDQRGESCVGAALCHALRLAARSAGFALDPSYLAIYALARMLERQSPAASLADRGCFPHRALEALEDWGVVARSRWSDAADLAQPVSIDVLEAGSSARVTGVYRAYEMGVDLVDLLQRSLFEGHGVFYAGPVGPTYKRLRGDVYDGESTHDGDHARCLVGYRPGAFLELNSWGSDWGTEGFAWVSEAYVTQRAFAHTVITAAPPEVL